MVSVTGLIGLCLLVREGFKFIGGSGWEDIFKFLVTVLNYCESC